MSSLSLPWRALRLFLRRHGTSYSAALAYRALSSFAPLLVVAVGLAGLLVGRATAETRLLSLIAAELGPRVSELAGLALDTVYAPGSGAWATAIAIWNGMPPEHWLSNWTIVSSKTRGSAAA